YNLFSVDRGCNRFIAVQLTLRALAEREDVRQALTEKHLKLPDAKPLNDYIIFAQKNKLGLGNPSLERFINENSTCFSLYKLLGWSEAINRTFPHISAKIPPFNGVEESLDLMAGYADIMVVSKTPYEDLANYWEAQGIARYVHIIAGQEMGSKAHHIEVAKKAGEYENDHVLMIGDGKGDLKGEDGFMSTIMRVPGDTYKVRHDKVPLNVVANSKREFPKEWITPNRIDVTDEFVNWAIPLIGEPLPQFAKFEDILAPSLCKKHMPVAFR
ncbi:unnamed protein product, partial [marine sediment metagenome]